MPTGMGLCVGLISTVSCLLLYMHVACRGALKQKRKKRKYSAFLRQFNESRELNVMIKDHFRRHSQFQQPVMPDSLTRSHGMTQQRS